MLPFSNMGKKTQNYVHFVVRKMKPYLFTYVVVMSQSTGPIIIFQKQL